MSTPLTPGEDAAAEQVSPTEDSSAEAAAEPASPRKPATRKPAARKPAARKPAARKPLVRRPAGASAVEPETGAGTEPVPPVEPSTAPREPATEVRFVAPVEPAAEAEPAADVAPSADAAPSVTPRTPRRSPTRKPSGRTTSATASKPRKPAAGQAERAGQAGQAGQAAPVERTDAVASAETPVPAAPSAPTEPMTSAVSDQVPVVAGEPLRSDTATADAAEYAPTAQYPAPDPAAADYAEPAYTGADYTPSGYADGAGGTPPPPRSPAAALADRLDEGGFFEALFDVTFTRYVTRRLAGPLYVVGLAVIALSVIYGIITSLATAVATGSAWGVLLFLFGLLLTVVGGMLAILLLRVAIEAFVAIVSIAENTRPRRRR